MYVLVTEKYRTNLKDYLSYTCDIITECQDRTDPAIKIDMYIILCVHAGWFQTHPCLKGYLREACASAFSLLLLQVLLIHLQGLYLPYYTLTCTLHVYKPTVWPVASRSLFLVIQVVHSEILVGRIHIVCTCKSLLHHYQGPISQRDLSPDLDFKFMTLVLNFVKRMLSLWS